MLTFNLTVISRLNSSKKIVRVGATQIINGKQQGQMSNKEYRFKVATIIIDFTFLFFYTPLAVSLTFGIVDLVNGSISADPLMNVIVNNLFSNIATLLAFAYAVALIFIFFIFNRYFRIEFLRILRIKKLTNQVETSTTRGN